MRVKLVKEFLTFLKKKGYTKDNLSTHFRYARSSNSSKASRGIEQREVRLTREGHNKLQRDLANLKTQQMGLAKEIRTAAADGDVRENSPLEAAREAQAMVTGKIREIEETLKRAIITEGTSTDQVTVGSKVKLTELNARRTFQYQLVESNEASALAGKISIQSPVGSAILNRRSGEEIKVATPRGQQIFRIDSIT